MAKLLVHFHCYYHEQVDYFIEKMSNICFCTWDLYVTYFEENKESFEKIRKLKPDAKFIKVENRGYDILPFINIIKSIDLSDYDYVLKLHTKNNQIRDISFGIGFEWRNNLVDTLMGTKLTFLMNLLHFKLFKKTGMIASFFSRANLEEKSTKADLDLIYEEIRKHELLEYGEYFCAGTMFLMRSCLLKYLQTNKIKDKDFALSKATNETATLAHAYERIFSIAVKSFSYEIYFKKQICKMFFILLKNIISISHEVQGYNLRTIIKIFSLKIKFKKPYTAPKIKDSKPKLYWKKRIEKPKGVVYTCITDNYDDIETIKAYKYTSPEFDYICFTDNQEHIKQGKIGIWQIKPLAFDKLDNTRNNRWHKLHPHILFPEYDKSVYIDANINILTSKYFELIKKTQKDIIIPRHHERICIYDEKNQIIKLKFDNEEVVNKQFEIIKNAGFPKNFGMFENNLIYRKHNSPEIIEMMEEWWHFIEHYSKRDQLSLMYIFWKHNRNPKNHEIENVRVDFKNFCWFPHKKGYILCKS